MKTFSIIFLTIIMINIWGNDTDQNRVNNFLYGPYLNDGTVPIININQAKVIENNPVERQI